MKILEYPTIKCKCGCKFSYTNEDKKEDSIFRITTPSGYKIYKVDIYVTCPMCNHIYILNSRSKVENP